MNCLGINGRGNTGSDLSSCCAGHGGRCSCWSWHGNHVAGFSSDSCAFACRKPRNCRVVWTVMARASVNTTAESSSAKRPTNTAARKPSATRACRHWAARRASYSARTLSGGQNISVVNPSPLRLPKLVRPSTSLEVRVTYGHANIDEATLLPGQVAAPNVRAQDVDAGWRSPSSCLKTRVLLRLASTPAPRSTPPVTTRRSGAAHSGAVTMYKSTKNSARHSPGRREALSAASESCWPSAKSPGARGSPCWTPSACAMSCTRPWSSHHK